MHRIDTSTAQKDKFGAGKNGFTGGNPQTGELPTALNAEFFDMLQEELCSVVEASGASLEKGRHDQLLTALRALLLSRKNPFGDIKSDGTVKTALENLGLGEGSALPVGVPVPWPLETPPTGWLKCNGAPFTASEYPKLAKAYPTNKLPDLRGEFIRGWDDGRGADNGRVLLSAQEATGISFPLGSFSNYSGIDIEDYETGKAHPSYGVYIAQTTQSSTGTTYRKVRPRNVAFNYIVRAV